MEDEPNLDRFYGNLRNYVRMVTGGYSNLLMLDAKGGLGKTHHVRETLAEECERDDDWVHQKGFTTPVELYKTLWEARGKDKVLFLDDVSGITSNTKAVDMLKSATDTEGDENWVQYRTSQDIEHPHLASQTLPNTFCFRGRVIISFNETPTNRHFTALKDRGTYYQLSFTYEERLEIIEEIAKKPSFSSLDVSTQRETAEWLKSATDASYEVTIRTFEEVCQMRSFARQQPDADWQEMALEIFGIDHEKHKIIQMREANDMPVSEQVEKFCEETGKSESHYYNLLSEIKTEKMG